MALYSAATSIRSRSRWTLLEDGGCQLAGLRRDPSYRRRSTWCCTFLAAARAVAGPRAVANCSRRCWRSLPASGQRQPGARRQDAISDGRPRPSGVIRWQPTAAGSSAAGHPSQAAASQIQVWPDCSAKMQRQAGRPGSWIPVPHSGAARASPAPASMVWLADSDLPRVIRSAVSPSVPGQVGEILEIAFWPTETGATASSPVVTVPSVRRGRPSAPLRSSSGASATRHPARPAGQQLEVMRSPRARGPLSMRPVTSAVSGGELRDRQPGKQRPSADQQPPFGSPKPLSRRPRRRPRSTTRLLVGRARRPARQEGRRSAAMRAPNTFERSLGHASSSLGEVRSSSQQCRRALGMDVAASAVAPASRRLARQVAEWRTTSQAGCGGHCAGSRPSSRRQRRPARRRPKRRGFDLISDLQRHLTLHAVLAKNELPATFEFAVELARRRAALRPRVAPRQVELLLAGGDLKTTAGTRSRSAAGDLK